MKKYTEFPYPSPNQRITIYGRQGCIYCEKVKHFINEVYSGNDKKLAVYHDIFEIIDNGQAKDVSDFKKKMKIFIGDFSSVPMIFIEGKFVGGYDTFCETLFSFVSHKNRPQIAKLLLVNKNLSINKNTKRIKNKLDKCEAVKSAMKKKSK